MQNSNLLKISIFSILTLGVATGVIFGKDKVKEVEAYSNYTEGSLPTTLLLEDASETTIRNYYSDLNNKGLNGTDLLKSLKPILSNGQKYFSYDSTSAKNAIWKAYEIVDRDWNLSPASDISGYNSTTNTITGYSYKASTSFDNKDNPYLHALYVDRSLENPIKAWGNHNQTAGGINQEHIWPKSHGFDTEAAGGARGDLMHLWAADGYSNKVHSNYSYGYVDKTKDFDSTLDTIYYATDNYLGTSKTLKSGTVFEPQDSDKGDIARALFYMAARYNNYAGDTDGIDSNNPYLVLKDVTSPANEKGSTCTATTPGEYGILSDLLEWNRLDPVDNFEIHRNNLLFNNYTKNRNPFIDFPQWAELIWGNNKTGSANPNTDTINGEAGSEEESTGEFEKATSLTIGDKVVIASEGVGMELTSFASNYGVGSQYNTNLQGSLIFDVCEGSTSNTFAFKNNNNYLSLTSGNNTLKLSSTLEETSSWTVSFDNGNAKITNVGDSTRSILWNIQNTRFSSYGDYQIKIGQPNSYKAVQLYKKDMSVRVTGITLDASSINLEEGKSAQLTATISPINASIKDVIWNSTNSAVASVVNGKITAIKAGNTVVSATTVDGSFVAQCSVSVTKAPVVESLSIEGDYKKNYVIDEEYSEDGLIIMAHLDNGNDVDVTSKATLSTIDTSESGAKTLTVSYGGKEASVTINVFDGVALLDSSLGLENGTAVTQLTFGDLIITFNKLNGSQATYYSAGESVRTYHSTSFTLTSNKIINALHFVFGTGDGSNALTPSSGTLTGNTWEGNSSNVTFSVGGTSGHRRINQIYFMTGENNSVDSITASGLIKTQYEVGESFDSTGLTVVAHLLDSTEVTLNSEQYVVEGFDSTSSGSKQLTISYTDSFSITKTTTVSYVVKSSLSKIELIPETTKVPFMSGNNGVLTVNSILNATFEDGSTREVTPSETSFEVDTKTLGIQKISASFGDLTTTADILVTNEGATQKEIEGSDGVLATGVISSKVFDVASTKTVGDLSLKLSTDAGYFGFDSNRGQQIGSSGNPATEITIETFVSGTISSVKVNSCGANGTNAVLSVSVGGVDFKYNKNASVNLTTTANEYEFVGSSSGAIVIKWTQSSEKAIYFKGISLTTDATTIYDWNGLDQAESWSAYFLAMTSPICEANPSGENGNELSEIWDDLEDEFEFMINESKTVFISSDSTTISDARERYIHILAHYGSTLNNFVSIDISAKPMGSIFNSLVSSELNSQSIIFVTIFFASSIIFIASYFVVRKRKAN